MMNFRRYLAAGLAAGTLLVSSASAVHITVDGAPFPGKAFARQGTTYVALRAMAEQLGDVHVSWNGRSAAVTSPNLKLTAGLGDRWLESNDRCFYIPNGIKALDGSLMVPVRVLAQAMGGAVQWDSASKTVRVSSGGGAPEEADYGPDALYWLSRIISAESRGEPLEGKLAVGTVVMNRVASPDFPNTIYGVIFDRKWAVQFTPVSNGTVYDPPTQESILAAKMVLEGARVAENALYFLDPTQTDDHWIVHNRTYLTTIGCHQFYR